MQLDKRTLQRMLTLDDASLASMIRSLAENHGLDLSSFNISPDDINSIRQALAGATDEDLMRATEQLRNFHRGKRG